MGRGYAAAKARRQGAAAAAAGQGAVAEPTPAPGTAAEEALIQRIVDEGASRGDAQGMVEAMQLRNRGSDSRQEIERSTSANQNKIQRLEQTTRQLDRATFEDTISIQYGRDAYRNLDLARRDIFEQRVRAQRANDAARGRTNPEAARAAVQVENSLIALQSSAKTLQNLGAFGLSEQQRSNIFANARNEISLAQTALTNAERLLRGG